MNGIHVRIGNKTFDTIDEANASNRGVGYFVRDSAGSVVSRFNPRLTQDEAIMSTARRVESGLYGESGHVSLFDENGKSIAAFSRTPDGRPAIELWHQIA